MFLRKVSSAYVAALGLCVTLAGCSGSSSNKTGSGTTTSNPAPSITTLSPTSATAGAAAQTLTINGTNFISSSTVTYNGTAHTATYVSGSQLTVALTATDQASAGTEPVVVTNPSPGGGASSAVNFTVNNPVPTVTSISPASVAAGSAAQTMTITGTNFVSTSTVTLGGTAITATYVSATQLTVALTAANQATAGTASVVVTNPAPGGGASAGTTFTVTSPAPTIAGVVYKGAEVASTVTAYAVNSDGSNGGTLGTATTDTNGAFTLPLTSTPTGPVRLTATGGTYTSEFDKTTSTGTSSISALLDSVTANVTGVSITPASEFVNSYTAGQMAGPGGIAEATAHQKASLLINSYMGLTSTDVLETMTPVFDKASITAAQDNFKLGLYIGSLATEGHTAVPATPDNLIAALSADISDGIFDGKAAGAAVSLPSGVTSAIRIHKSLSVAGKSAAIAKTKGVGDRFAALDASSAGNLSPTAGTTDLLSALGTYITTGAAVTSAGITPSDVTGLETAMFAGVSGCTCTPASAGLQSSSSNATASYAIGGHQYLINAARQEGVVVVDITDPTATSPAINAWPSISSTVFGGADVGGVIVVTGLTGHPQVLAFAYQSTTITLLNLNTLISGNPATDNPVDFTTTLALNATYPVEFSGGNAYIAGGIPDSGGTTTSSAAGVGVWLDTADGYGFLPLSALTGTATSVSLTGLLPITDTSQFITENLGGDIQNQQLLGGDYGGLELTDLKTNQNYYLDTAGLVTAFPTLSQLNFNPEFIDGNAIDGTYRIGILTSEDENVAAFVNLAQVTENNAATGGVNTLTIPTGAFTAFALGTTGGMNGGGPDLDGVAVDKNSHLALFMNGYSVDFAVGALQDPNSVPTGSTWSGMSDWSYFDINSSPEFSDYVYATDPHSVGVVTNLSTGTPFGYLFDGSTDRGIVQIDMTNFLAMPRQGTTGDASHQPTGDPGATTTSIGGLVLQEFTWTDPTSPIPAVKKAMPQETNVPQAPVNQPKK